MNQPTHSPLGASSYSRWKACPGSVRLSRGIFKPSSPAAEEGTRAHELAEKILRGEPCEAPQEMVEAVLVYVDFVRSWGGWERWLEQRFDLSAYHPMLYGTADCVLYDRQHKILNVIDYKHGQGVVVEVESEGTPNVQLMYYALGALHQMRLPVAQVILTIVQPRAFHPQGSIRSVTVDPLEFLDFGADLAADARATEKFDAPLNPGSHCRWCAAQGICPAIKEKSLALAKLEFSPVLSYDPAKLSYALANLPMLEAFVKGVREFAYHEAELGRPPPGWKLVPKRAHRKWKPDAEKMIERRFKLQTNQTHDIKLKSPAQIEKLLPKELRVQLDELTLKESSGHSLVPETDSRSSLSAGAAEAFDVIED